MKVTKHSKNVHAIECGRTQEFLLLSDLHWDNPKCDRALLTNHLEEAKRRGAKVLVNGDFFCLMQGKGDPRRSKDDIRPEHNNGRYLDSIVDTAVEWFRPYADLLLVLGYGNHETSIIQHQETDILLRFATILNHSCKTDIQVGGYGGVLDFKMIYDPDHRCNFIMHYYHGSGGGGPVTKGVIQDQRILASIEGYDCTWQGHVHELYYHQNIVNRYVRTTHQILQKPVHQVRTATYKEEWADGYMGFHVERGRGPKPLGGYWMTLEAGRFVGKDRRGPELQVFASFAPCDRFYTAGS
jgi:hypothetical protein